MALIIKLPQSTIQLIAAGEVITRPVNIVKELLENSLDAGSTNIRVNFQQGGLKFIEVIDNGQGIARSNAELLCCRYTTSKLTKADDLNRIATFGFRGEALASISEMSDVEVKSFNMTSDLTGWEAKYRGGKLVGQPVDRYLQHAGTQLKISNIFSSITTRKIALQSNFIEEKRAIIDLITRYAIHYRQKVTISLREGSSPDLICLIAPMDTRPCLGMFFGVEMEENLIDVPIDSSKVRGKIVISFKKLTSNTGNFNFILFVNNRLVECNDLKKEIEVSMNEFLTVKMFSSISYVDLRVPANDVDVNMHPAKSTVALHHKVEIINHIVVELRKKLKEKLSSNTIVASTPISQRTVGVLLKPASSSQPCSSSKTIPMSDSLPETPSSQISTKRLRLLAPGSVNQVTQVKRSYDLVHNDFSQRTLAQLTGARSTRPIAYAKKDGMDDIQPYPGSETSLELSKIIMQPPASPGSDTIVSDNNSDTHPKIIPPERPRRDLKLRSIMELRKLVAKEKDIESAHVIKNSIFVGIFDHERALIQHETKLYAINLRSFLVEQFYQFYLFDFGNFPPIEILPPGNKIKFILQTFLEDAQKHDIGCYKSLKFNTADSIIEQLMRYEAMFEDYLTLKLSKDEIISIPCIMPEEVPNLTYLGRFLVKLANFVDYSNEKNCLHQIGRILAEFYAEAPAKLKNMDIHRKYHDLIESKLYEAIKRYLIIPEWLFTKENICQISDTKDLYKVFERC